MAEATALSTATYTRDWRAAFAAVRKLLADPNDTVQVFRIMQALNGAASKWGYEKLVSTPEGGRMAYNRVELCEKLMDRAWVDSFAPGTVGAAYRDFLDRTGYSAKGLAIAIGRWLAMIGARPHRRLTKSRKTALTIWSLHDHEHYQSLGPTERLRLYRENRSI